MDELRPGRSADWYGENPQAKMSFTRLASFRRCPGWFRHQYLEWHRSWSTPILRVGHVVQDVLERVFDGVPAADVTIEALEERAYARLETLFAEEWEKARRAHEEDPNGRGPWDLPRSRYQAYMRTGLRWHILEVVARQERRHPRTGEALDLPEATGIADAWEAARPWHAPHDVEFEAGMETVPGGFFQGQFDLVYDWTGARRIVDLKASGGSSVFSTEIELQLLAYVYLERALGRGRPEGIEAWFLGAGEPKVYPVPDDDALLVFAREVVDLIARSGSEVGFDAWDPDEFEPRPATVTGFAVREGEPSAWCAYCPAAYTCERSARQAPPAGPGLDFRRPPKAGAIDVQGIVLGVAEPRERADGRVKRRFTLANASGVNSFTWEEGIVRRLIEQGLRAGRVVRITDVRPWTHPASGRTMYFDSRTTRLEVLSEDPQP